jgi:flagellar capping protein FliD
MSKLLTRYTQQFGAMESIVGRNNSTKEGLKSTFEGMMNAYK